MPRALRLAVVASLLSTILLAGCGGGDEARPVDVSKSVDQTQFKGMLEQMKAKVKADKSGKPLIGK